MVRDRGLSPTRLQEVYEARIAAELAAANALVPGSETIAGAGDLLAEVVLLKGFPGAADIESGRALAGPDGEAAAKALGALGLDPQATYAACTRGREKTDAAARASRVKLLVEAIDPRVVLALDMDAAEDLSAAFGTKVVAGHPAPARGRTLAAVDGLEASLSDERAKSRVWKQMQAIRQTPAGKP